jgi:hypothetical protein
MAGLMVEGLPHGGLLAGGLAPAGRVLALSTAADAAAGLPFGLDINTLQTYVLLYLGLSSLVFVLVWVVGYLRSR